MIQFVDALDAAMVRASLNQAGLIVRTGLSQGAISAYMNGRRTPDLGSFIRLCAVLPELHLWIASRAYAFAAGETIEPELDHEKVSNEAH